MIILHFSLHWMMTPIDPNINNNDDDEMRRSSKAISTINFLSFYTFRSFTINLFAREYKFIPMWSNCQFPISQVYQLRSKVGNVFSCCLWILHTFELLTHILITELKLIDPNYTDPKLLIIVVAVVMITIYLLAGLFAEEEEESQHHVEKVHKTETPYSNPT